MSETSGSTANPEPNPTTPEASSFEIPVPEIPAAANFGTPEPQAPAGPPVFGTPQPEVTPYPTTPSPNGHLEGQQQYGQQQGQLGNNALPSDGFKGKRLMRNTDNQMIGGVASGIADYFGIDVTLVRIVFAALTVFSGTGVILYGIGWCVMPDAKGDTLIAKNGRSPLTGKKRDND